VLDICIKQVFVLYSVILCTMYNPLVPELEQGHAGINFICSNSKATQRTDSAVFTVKYLHRDKDKEQLLKKYE
jgi:hypothetical protein